MHTQSVYASRITQNRVSLPPCRAEGGRRLTGLPPHQDTCWGTQDSTAHHLARTRVHGPRQITGAGGTTQPFTSSASASAPGRREHVRTLTPHTPSAMCLPETKEAAPGCTQGGPEVGRGSSLLATNKARPLLPPLPPGLPRLQASQQKCTFPPLSSEFWCQNQLCSHLRSYPVLLRGQGTWVQRAHRRAHTHRGAQEGTGPPQGTAAPIPRVHGAPAAATPISVSTALVTQLDRRAYFTTCPGLSMCLAATKGRTEGWRGVKVGWAHG